MEKTGRLDLKYRPTDFDEIFGNEETVEGLKSMLSRDAKDRSRTILLYGPSGCGKTTLAKIAAHKLGAVDRDIIIYNISNMRGIDAAREIIHTTNYVPMSSKVKVYILDEVHKATNEFQNAMLQVLEEPPKHVCFVLCTTEPEKLLKTVRNRCNSYQVKSLPRPTMTSLLRTICTKEEIRIPREVHTKIARLSQGSPRQALVILDSIIGIEDKEAMLEAVDTFVVSEASAIDICRTLVSGKGDKWKEVSRILKGLDDDPEKVRRIILGYLSKVLLNNGDYKVAEMMELFLTSYMYQGKPGLVHSCYLACKI